MDSVGALPDSITKKPRRGRPRKRPRSIDEEPREEILAAAAGLFTTKGFAATTTREIASASGLEQGSLFHYFRRKDAILAELLDRTLDPAVAFAAWLDKQRARPDEKLFLLAYRDTLNICSGPHNLASLMHLPEAKRPEFASYWEKRLKLKATYGRYVGAGLRQGLFDGIEGALATELVFAMVESTIQWFVRGRDDAPRVAQHVATAALRLLVHDDRRLRDVVGRAASRTSGAPFVDQPAPPG
jgi:AcrR family transcriptional regulator